jgi:hypothetical protein
MQFEKTCQVQINRNKNIETLYRAAAVHDGTP